MNILKRVKKHYGKKKKEYGDDEMTEKRFTVKQLIKYLADFNPNAVIMNNINPSWVTGMEEEEIRDIDNEKLNALNVWLFDDDEEVEK